mmetsp:Transcript_62006/g.115938  ORF Transcript_62006/g.115938 Transcript_62006/m.115938 type:complete len:88 (-) Transcript_62006:105-368(-)
MPLTLTSLAGKEAAVSAVRGTTPGFLQAAAPRAHRHKVAQAAQMASWSVPGNTQAKKNELGRMVQRIVLRKLAKSGRTKRGWRESAS